MIRWLVLRQFWIFLISVWRVRSDNDEQPLTIRPWESDELFFSEGDPLNIHCDVNATTAVRFRWFRNGESLFFYDSLLSIEKASQNDAGVYRCSVSNQFGTVLSLPLKVNIFYIYGFHDKFKKTKLVPLNDPFVIKAPRLNASEQLTDYLTWKWFRDDTELLLDRDFYVTLTGDLIVLNPSYAVGTYHAEVLYGESRFSSAEVIVSNDYSKVSQPKFKILYEPKSRAFLRESGKSAVFECVPSFFDASVSISWSIDGHAPGKNSEFSELKRRFIMLSLEEFGDANKLEVGCRVTRNGIWDTAKAYMDIYSKPRIIRNSFGNVHSKQPGDFVELNCDTSGYPEPTVRWLRDGEAFFNGSVLHLGGLKAEEFGMYQCEATNPAGVAMANTWIKHRNGVPPVSFASAHGKPPKLLKSSSNVTAALGDEIDLLCRFDGTPLPFVKWKFKDKAINPGNKYKINGEFLHISSVNSEDSGVYSCSAVNRFGSDEAFVELLIVDSSFIEYGPTNTSILIGSNTEMPCKVRDEYIHNSDVVITWLWQEMPIPTSGDVIRRLTIKKNGALEIKHVGPDNIGLYTCKVSVGSKQQEVSAWLKVIEKPSMPAAVKAELLNDTVPARIQVSWKQGFDGNSALIKHIVEMRSLGPTGLWSDWEIVDENVPTELCCSTRIDNLKPSSTVEFRVTAVNRHGTGKPSLPSNNITMPQQPPAAAPRNVAASPRTPSSIMVQWQPPPPEQWNGDILGYIIRYRLANYASLPWNEKNVSDSNKRNAALEHLITWREYEIQVAAYNHRGMGVFSRAYLVSTLEGVPTQAPKNVEVRPINSTAIVVSFDPPDPQMIPGVNLGYKIDLWKGPINSSRLFRQVKVLPDEKNISEAIGDLEKFGHYNVTVLCYTTPGDGPRSEPVEVVTLEDLPNAVDSVRFDSVLFSSVNVIWDPPSEPNGVIQKYSIRYWEEGKPGSSQLLELDPEIHNITIGELAPSTHYTVEIQAFTSVGGGPKLEAKFESGVPPELPGRPTSLEISEIGSRSVMLRFLPGFDGHTFIHKWIVEGKLSSSSTFYPIFEIKAPKARSLLVEKLRPFTRYQLRLVAENVRGRSPPSDATEEFTTLQAEPDLAPEILFAEPVSATSISVVWTPLRLVQWNGHPKGYLILYRSKNAEANLGWKEIRVSNSKTGDFVLTDLRPYTNYEIELTAENSVGRSKRSAKVEAKTYEDVPSGAPFDVELLLKKPRMAVVLWRPIDNNLANGIVVGYKVRLEPIEERYRIDFSRHAEVDAASYKTTFAQLRPFLEYRAIVCAFTMVGSGPENSSSSMQSSEDVPGEPYNVAFSSVSESEVHLKWNPPLSPNGIILNYEIMHWKNGNEKDATKIKLPFNVYGFTATGLQKNSHYRFAVSAETAVGWGPQAVVSVMTTNDLVPLPTPSMPQKDDAKPESSTEISLKWKIPAVFADIPDLNMIRLTDVEYQTYDSEWVQIPSPISGTRDAATIAGLKPNTNYRARIRFNSDFSQSGWSAESPWIKTLDDVPSASPTLIQASPFESSSLLLQWQSPPRDQWNSDSIRFRISYRVYFSNETAVTEDVEMSEDGSMKVQYVVEKLKSFRHYVVQVQTVNDLGASAFSSPMFAYVGYSIPKRKVTNLVAEPVSSTSIMARWDQWEDRAEDVISGFKIRYLPVLPVLSNDENLEEVIISENNSILLTELRKYTEYQISVSTYNRAGEGEMTVVRATTLEDRPGPVSGLTFSDILLDSVNVSWSAPVEANGKILGYLNEFKKEVQEKTSLTYQVATGLEPNVTYYFSVRAETAVGYGSEVTGNVSISPIPGCPEPPSKPRLLPGQTSVALEWQNGKPGDAPIKGHIIQAKRVARAKESVQSPSEIRSFERLEDSFGQLNRIQHIIGEWNTLSNIQGKQSHYEISYKELEASSFYVFRVFARNFYGAGFASPESEQLHVPASLPEDPFYTKWWFIVMVALVTFVIVVVVVALLCVTGSRYKYAKRNSVDSLQLADGGIVSYELRASKRRNLPHLRRDIPARPNTNTSWISDSREPPAYGSIGDVAPTNNMYGSLATDLVSPERRTSALVNMGFGRPLSAGRYSNHDLMLDGFSGDADSVEDFEEQEEQEPNIAQHYDQDDTYRQTWRRARAEALAEAAPPRQSRPASRDSMHSEIVMVTTPQNNHGSSLMNGFSSFV